MTQQQTYDGPTEIVQTKILNTDRVLLGEISMRITLNLISSRV